MTDESWVIEKIIESGEALPTCMVSSIGGVPVEKIVSAIRARNVVNWLNGKDKTKDFVCVIELATDPLGWKGVAKRLEGEKR